jgi:hypothetical protein
MRDVGMVRIADSLYSEGSARRLGISVCIYEVGIDLNLREWIRVDYFTYD